MHFTCECTATVVCQLQNKFAGHTQDTGLNAYFYIVYLYNPTDVCVLVCPSVCQSISSVQPKLVSQL